MNNVIVSMFTLHSHSHAFAHFNRAVDVTVDFALS